MKYQFSQLADLHDFKPGEKIVAMCPYKDMTIVATEYHVYIIKDGKISLMEFEIMEATKVVQGG